MLLSHNKVANSEHTTKVRTAYS